ncbi:EF-hand domain-containing protein [Myceligenerans sp. TRM 65318]|uniref:EF-hand domain-containing protein n=1 Tax=Myceligenerans pegani TaxID=2776917 RepID=A0ABR9MWJ3_9MICO|nr:EF-hand domain-containing protein [Myceligenerans sp. TRM 65318]MBE3018036.1 EF-hand domain-containing protein [Myceligenerans sp. TRM 65318]
MTAEDELTATFNEFDNDDDGHITVEEFRQAMSRRGDEVTNDDLTSIFVHADGDGDGKINLEEFTAAWNG